MHKTHSKAMLHFLFNERLRELCAKTQALQHLQGECSSAEACGTLPICAFCVQRAASIFKMLLHWGLKPTTEVEIGLSHAYRGRSLRSIC